MGNKIVVNGASLKCDKGSGPCTLAVVRPSPAFTAEGQAIANAKDSAILNIASFVMCKSTSNPAVVAVMTATKNAVKEAPCVPAIASPWSDPSKLLTVAGDGAVTEKSTVKCSYGGTVKVDKPGQALVTVAK